MPIYLVDFVRRGNDASPLKGLAVTIAGSAEQAKHITRVGLADDGIDARVEKAEEVELERVGVVLMLDHALTH
jgi:hypothetical protein